MTTEQTELTLTTKQTEVNQLPQPSKPENKPVIDFDTKFTNAKGQLDQLAPKLFTMLLSDTVKKDKVTIPTSDDFVAITSKLYNHKQYTNCLYVAWDVLDDCPKIFNPFGFPLIGEIISYKIRKSNKDVSFVNVVIAGIELILLLKHYNHDIDDFIPENSHVTLLPDSSDICIDLLIPNKINPCYTSDLPEGRDYIINGSDMIDDCLYLHITSLEKKTDKGKLNRLDCSVLADRTLRTQSSKGFKTFKVVKHSQNKGKDGKTYTDTSYIFN